MEEKELAWGVRFEIARLVSKGHLAPKEVTPEKLDLLRGSNKESAPRVLHVFANASEKLVQFDQAFAQEMAANVKSCIDAVLFALLTTCTVALGRTRSRT